jgi:hypothetical protein
MTQNNDSLGTSQLRGKFEASDDIGVDEIAGDAGDEDVAYLLIED